MNLKNIIKEILRSIYRIGIRPDLAVRIAAEKHDLSDDNALILVKALNKEPKFLNSSTMWGKL